MKASASLVAELSEVIEGAGLIPKSPLPLLELLSLADN